MRFLEAHELFRNTVKRQFFSSVVTQKDGAPPAECDEGPRVADISHVFIDLGLNGALFRGLRDP